MVSCRPIGNQIGNRPVSDRPIYNRRQVINLPYIGVLPREIKKASPELLRRLDWDSEAGAVGVFAKTEEDIRSVADVVNSLFQSRRAVLKYRLDPADLTV